MLDTDKEHGKCTKKDTEKNAENDARYWLGRYEKEKEWIPAIQEDLERFSNRDQLDDEAFIQLAMELGTKHRYVEFFTVVDEALRRAGTAHPRYNALLQKEAVLSEIVFDFDRSLAAWRALEERGAFPERAQQKRRDLEIVRDYLAH